MLLFHLVPRNLPPPLGTQNSKNKAYFRIGSWTNIDVPIQIGKQKYIWNILAAPIDAEFMLGLDFMKKHKGHIDLENDALILCGDKIQGQMVCNDGSVFKQVRRVTLARKIVVPPRSVLRTKTRLNAPCHKILLVQSAAQEHKGALIPNMLISTGDSKNGCCTVPIAIRNESDTFVHLKKGHVLGDAKEIQSEQVHEKFDDTESIHGCSVRTVAQEPSRGCLADGADSKCEHSYEVGDLVLKLNKASKTGEPSKLQPIWKGPFLVIEMLSPLLMRIRGKKKSMVVHHDLVKKCTDRYIPAWMQRLRNQYLNGATTVQEEEMVEDADFQADEDLGLAALFDADDRSVDQSSKGCEDVQEYTWVQCDVCDKWRRILKKDARAIPKEDPWRCSQNMDVRFSSCQVPEEDFTD